MTMTTFAELQDVIERTYGDRDRERGVSATVAWLAEELGELAQAVRKGSHDDKVHEFGATTTRCTNSVTSLRGWRRSPISRESTSPRRSNASPTGARSAPRPRAPVHDRGSGRRSELSLPLKWWKRSTCRVVHC